MQPIRIPGTFVVLQGVPGDGLSNSIDSFPSFHDDMDSEDDVQRGTQNRHDEEKATSEGSITPQDATCAPMTVEDPFASSLMRVGIYPLAAPVTPTSVTVSCATVSAETSAIITDTSAISEHCSTSESPINNHTFVVVSDDSFQSMEERATQEEEKEEDATNPSPAAQERSSGNCNATNQDDDDDDDDATPTTVAAATAVPTLHEERQEEDFRTVEEIPPLSQPQKQALEEWMIECRENELHHRREWYEASASLNYGNYDFNGRNKFDGVSTPWWMADDGCLALFDGLPLHIFGLVPGFPRPPVGKLAPGTVVVAAELVTLDSNDLVTRVNVASFSADNESEENGVEVSHYPQGRPGWVQILKLVSPVNGYCVLSVDGYSFLGPGLPVNYCDCNEWYWRVTCIEGAFVRRGLDLSSEQLATIPYGSLVRVNRKTVNEMALSRLQIEALLYNDDGSQDLIEGWISEFLNPLSGQRGPIVLPVPFPVPALYEVILPQGAVIRSDVELSSPTIGHAPQGAILCITGRKYSENPKDKCVARYQLAGNGGWISVRLNLAPPDDVDVVKFVGSDSTFDPDKAGLFHLAAMSTIQSQQQRLRTAPRAASTISSIGDDADSVACMSNMIDDSADAQGSTDNKPPSCTYSATSATSAARLRRNGPTNDHCLICLCEDRTATIVHGETGHVACCLVCARILKARGDPCPVCRLPIDIVVQHFWA